MKELNVMQMDELQGGNVLACGALIAVGLVGIAGGLGFFAVGVIAALASAEGSPC